MLDIKSTKKNQKKFTPFDWIMIQFDGLLGTKHYSSFFSQILQELDSFSDITDYFLDLILRSLKLVFGKPLIIQIDEAQILTELNHEYTTYKRKIPTTLYYVINKHLLKFGNLFVINAGTSLDEMTIADLDGSSFIDNNKITKYYYNFQ